MLVVSSQIKLINTITTNDQVNKACVLVIYYLLNLYNQTLPINDGIAMFMIKTASEASTMAVTEGENSPRKTIENALLIPTSENGMFGIIVVAR